MLKRADCNHDRQIDVGDAGILYAHVKCTRSLTSPSHFVYSEGIFKVVPSTQTTCIGNTVDFTVYCNAVNMTAAQFTLVIPEGMTYVTNSAQVPSKLETNLGWSKAEWTESSMMWTGYNDLPINIQQDTVFLTYQCIVDAPSEHTVHLENALIFNSYFKAIRASVVVDTVSGSIDHAMVFQKGTATCEQAGTVDNYYCESCDMHYLDQAGTQKVDTIWSTATGHNYENGYCSTCGETDPDYVKPVVIPTLTLKAPTLEFKDMITVNAMFTAENLDSVVEMGMITYTEKVDVVDVNTAAHVIPGTTLDESTGRYFSRSQGIHAKYLGDTVYLACYAKLTDGSYVYTKLAGYSPITYATNQLKNSTNTQLKQLVAAMLNYGAEAQLYFGHNVDALANAGMTAEQLALPEAYRADMVGSVPAASATKQGVFANNKGFTVRKPAISFEGAFSINYFFTPAYAPVDGITLYYWNESDFNAADVLTVENASGSIAMVGEGMGQYRGDITGISAKDLSKAVYVAAVYSDGTTTWTSGVLGYSIGAYCSNQSNTGSTIAALAEATAVYGYHAKQYFGFSVA